jgi:hypothetical protein
MSERLFWWKTLIMKTAESVRLTRRRLHGKAFVLAPDRPPPFLIVSVSAKIYAALIHYPVIDKQGHVVSTSVTNLDIHDISRAASTYGLAGYFLVTPIEAQHWLTRRIIRHWEEGWGSTYNPTRKAALSVVAVKSDIGEVAAEIENQCGTSPVWIATSAKQYPNTISYGDLRSKFQQDETAAYCLMFGTGWGLHPELMAEADLILEPIIGAGEFNHLSVRSAASIIFDRLLSPQR